MATQMQALNSPNINHAEFIKLELPSQTLYFCNAAQPITVDGNTFTNLSSLLQLGDIQRDIKATSDDLTITLTGIDTENISIILSSQIKGSKVHVWRGFLDSDNQIIQIPQQQFFKRYQGIVGLVSITEDWDEGLRTRVASCTIACSSMRQILENRIAGFKSNPSSWKNIHPNDKSMDRVPVISATYFDFGGQPQTKTQSS